MMPRSAWIDGQRDVHDRRVEHDHQLGDRDDDRVRASGSGRCREWVGFGCCGCHKILQEQWKCADRRSPQTTDNWLSAQQREGRFHSQRKPAGGSLPSSRYASTASSMQRRLLEVRGVTKAVPRQQRGILKLVRPAARPIGTGSLDRSSWTPRGSDSSPRPCVSVIGSSAAGQSLQGSSPHARAGPKVGAVIAHSFAYFRTSSTVPGERVGRGTSPRRRRHVELSAYLPSGERLIRSSSRREQIGRVTIVHRLRESRTQLVVVGRRGSRGTTAPRRRRAAR